MKNWNKIILHKQGMPIKVYINQDQSCAVVFCLFGKYSTFRSDKSALDLAVEIIFHVISDDSIPQMMYSYSQYLNCQEDTVNLRLEEAG